MSQNKDNNIKQFERLKLYFSQLNLPLTKSEILNLDEVPLMSKSSSCLVKFINSDTTTALYEYPHSLTLVFSSAKNPGGGVLRGSIAQEEDIARTTTWYFQVKDNPFYLIEHSDLMYSSYAVYVKSGYLLLNEYGINISPQNVSLIGIAAPNLKGMISNNSAIKSDVIYQTYKQRLSALFAFAEKEKYEYLIVGAWGCGVFGLDPSIVADIYQAVIKQGLYTGQVIFAIPDKNIFNIFETKIKDQ